MFQANLNDIIIAEANTRTELAAQVAHEADVGRLCDTETGEYITIDDCDVVEIACFEHQTVKARNTLGLGAHRDMLFIGGGLPLATLEKFCQDGHTDDDDLSEMAYAFEQAGATKAAAIARGFIGL